MIIETILISSFLTYTKIWSSEYTWKGKCQLPLTLLVCPGFSWVGRGRRGGGKGKRKSLTSKKQMITFPSAILSKTFSHWHWYKIMHYFRCTSGMLGRILPSWGRGVIPVPHAPCFINRFHQYFLFLFNINTISVKQRLNEIVEKIKASHLKYLGFLR